MKTLILFLLTLTINQSFEYDSSCDLVKDILLHEKIADYLHANLKNRSVLYIVENDLCNSNFKINENLNVVMIKKGEIKKGMNYLSVESIKKESAYKIISLVYPIEGVVFKIYFND